MKRLPKGTNSTYRRCVTGAVISAPLNRPLMGKHKSSAPRTIPPEEYERISQPEQYVKPVVPMCRATWKARLAQVERNP